MKLTKEKIMWIVIAVLLITNLIVFALVLDKSIKIIKITNLYQEMEDIGGRAINLSIEVNEELVVCISTWEATDELLSNCISNWERCEARN